MANKTDKLFNASVKRRLEKAEADCEQHELEEKIPFSERIDKPRMR